MVLCEGLFFYFIKDLHIYTQSAEMFGLIKRCSYLVYAFTFLDLIQHTCMHTLKKTYEQHEPHPHVSTCCSLTVAANTLLPFDYARKKNISDYPHISSLTVLQGMRENLCSPPKEIEWWQFNGLRAQSTTPLPLYIKDPTPIQLVTSGSWTCSVKLSGIVNLHEDEIPL